MYRAVLWSVTCGEYKVTTLTLLSVDDYLTRCKKLCNYWDIIRDRVDLKPLRLPRIPQGLSALHNASCHVPLNLLMKRSCAIITRLLIKLTAQLAGRRFNIHFSFVLTCLLAGFGFRFTRLFHVYRNEKENAPNITITFVITCHYTYRIDRAEEKERMRIISHAQITFMRGYYNFLFFSCFFRLFAFRINPPRAQSNLQSPNEIYYYY